MNNKIKDFKKLWGFHRGHTLDLLGTLSDEELGFKVGQNMGTLGQQFRHLARVDDQYISAIESHKVGNNRKKLNFLLEESVQKLTEQLKADDIRLFSLLNQFSDEDIRIDWSYWGEKELTLSEHLDAMVEHEILHHGELIVYFRVMGKQFPDSWKAWGL